MNTPADGVLESRGRGSNTAASLRLVSWNIRHGGGRHAEGICRQLSVWNPDAVVILEYRTSAASRRVRDHLASGGLIHQIDTHGPASTGYDNGLLVAARWPVSRVNFMLEGVSPLRHVLTRIEAPTPIIVGGIHVPNRGEPGAKKYACLSALVETVRSWNYGPGLIVGDFNTGRKLMDEESRFFNSTEDAFMVEMEEAGWRDAFRYLHGDRRAFSWWNRYKGNATGFRLDHAFVGPDLLPHLRGCDLVRNEEGEWPSDHSALVVDLRLGPS